MSDDELKQRLRDGYLRLKEQIGLRIVGMEEVIDLTLMGILSGGHCLLMGVPGLAKTLLVSSIAELLELEFSRIQFTPDLMPGDIVGTELIAEASETGQREFRFMSGPIFANIVLADEINRTPPKTQAALMEAMEERQVTIGGRSHPLEPPFFVLATQNPIEQEGTYPLPAAQLDRFSFLIHVSYPSRRDELQVVRRTTAPGAPRLVPVLARSDILQIMDFLARTPAPADAVQLATDAARGTRPKEAPGDSPVARYLSWGVGPRGAQAVVTAAKVRAILHGRDRAGVEDIAALAPHAFRHRMILNFRGAAEGILVDDLLAEVMQSLLAKAG